MADLTRQEITSDEAVGFAIDSVLYRLRTATVGVVQSFNAAQNTVTVQPCIMRKQRGKSVAEPLPVLQDIPVAYYGAGGYVVTFQPQKGDYCVLMASDRSLARWKLTGGVVDPAQRHRHDLSDSVAYFGLNEFSGAIGSLRAGMDIRTRDGQTSFHLEDGKQTMTVGGTKVAEMTSSGVEFFVPVTGTSGTFGGITVESHVHGGVQSGASNTGGPQ